MNQFVHARGVQRQLTISRTSNKIFIAQKYEGKDVNQELFFNIESTEFKERKKTFKTQPTSKHSSH